MQSKSQKAMPRQRPSRKAMDEKHRELRLLQTIAMAANNADTIEEALQISLDEICAYSVCEAGHAYFVSEENPDELVSAKIWHLENPERCEALRRASEAARFTGGTDLPVRVWESGMPRWIVDVNGDANFPRAKIACEIGVKSVFAIPVFVENEVVAVMEFFSRQMKAPDERMLQVMTPIGYQLGRVFERRYNQRNLTRAYNELELRVKERTADLIQANASLNAEVCERRKAEAALRASEERYDLAVRGSSDGIWDWNMRTNELYFSQHYKELLGYTDNEFENDFLSFESHLHPDDHDLVIDRIHDHVWRRQPFDVEYRMRTKSGDYRWFRARAQAIWNGDDRASRMAGSISDITDRKQAEAELRTALEREKELGQLKSRFVSMASHEFRTPLTTILAASDLLKRYSHKMSEEEKSQRLNKIQDEVKHMTDMLNDVLTFGKADAGKVEFRPAPMNVKTFCEELSAELHASTGARIVFSSAGAHPQVLMDVKLLRHIITNLLTNAVKYSPSGSLITFDLLCENGETRFKITDQGIGIPEEDCKRLFEPFHRAVNVGNISGTGLGLAIVKKSVDLHGGTISVESIVGVGTTFIVAIPVDK
jgi:PAS domain S-box-containing protein